MSRVLISERTGAGIYVFSDDHCPPHVHARHRRDGWIARVRFSYMDDHVALMSIAPLQSAPLQRVVRGLLVDVRAGLSVCRRQWWVTRQTTCLTNVWITLRAAGRMTLSAGSDADARQIASVRYDSEQETLLVTFRDGAAANVSIRP